jgi:hypothetical protein
LSYSALDGTIAVAWEEAGVGDPPIRYAYLAIWDGAKWRTLSGAALSSSAVVTSAASTRPLAPQISVGRSALVALRADKTIRSWQGTVGTAGWTALGASLNKDGTKQAGIPSLGSGGSDVAWIEEPPSYPGTVTVPMSTVWGDAYVSEWLNGAWSMVGGGKLNSTGRLAQTVYLEEAGVVAFSDWDPTAKTYGLFLRLGSTTRTWSPGFCTGAILDDTTRPVDAVALAGVQGNLVAFIQSDQVNVKQCGASGWGSLGSPGPHASGPLHIALQGAEQIPTVTYLDTQTSRIVLKQPNK